MVELEFRCGDQYISALTNSSQLNHNSSIHFPHLKQPNWPVYRDICTLRVPVRSGFRQIDSAIISSINLQSLSASIRASIGCDPRAKFLTLSLFYPNGSGGGRGVRATHSQIQALSMCSSDTYIFLLISQHINAWHQRILLLSLQSLLQTHEATSSTAPKM